MSSGSSILVIGGGVIGLSVAWELVSRGHSVTLLEKDRLGSKASWAGAGILAPANSETATQPFDELLGLGSDLHEHWHARLLELTGIDNGYRNCGGIYIAYTAGDKAALAGQKLNWNDYEIPFEEIDVTDERARNFGFDSTWELVSVPGESQIRNPDHLRAMAKACELSGVRIVQDCGNLDFKINGGELVSVTSSRERFEKDHVCFCAGAWTTELIARLGAGLPMIPVRGQMLLFKLETLPFTEVINVGSRYIVPREDGHVLVGSTMEEVGFDDSTTQAQIDELQQFASRVCPLLTAENRIRQWAGLRPATNDGFPFIGKLSPFENVSVATGHFRCGLQMAPATAVLVADIIAGEDTIMQASPFDPSRLDLELQFELPLAQN